MLRIVFKKGFWVSSNTLAASLGKILCFFHLKLSMQWIILITLNVESCLKITSSYNELSHFFRCCPFWYQLFIELLNCFCPLAGVAPTGLSGDPFGNMSWPGTGEQRDPDLDAASASTVHLQALPHFICKFHGSLYQDFQSLEKWHICPLGFSVSSLFLARGFLFYQGFR